MDNQFVRYFSGLGTNANMGTEDNLVRETVLNGFFTIHQNGNIKYCNQIAESLIGGASGSLTGKNLWEDPGMIVPPDLFKITRRPLNHENPGHFEEYPGTIGEWLDVILYYCDDELSISFKRVRSAPTVNDLQRDLMRLNRLYRVVTEITSDCIWEWDLETKEIFWVDGGHQRVFGYQIENALIPQSFWEQRIHADDRKRVLESLNHINVLDPDAHWEQEYRFQKSDGSYAYVQDRGKVFHDKDVEGLRMTGTTQDISALHAVQLELETERQTKTRTSLKSSSEAQEAERRDISNEIYSDLSQTLCAARLYIECAKSENEKSFETLHKSSEYVLQVINQLHSIYKKLRLPGMYYGLFDSVQMLINKLNKQAPVIFDLRIKGLVEDELEDMLQLDMYRIIHELLDNVVKHAGATHASVDISRFWNEVILMVSDNGLGCNLAKTAMGTGITQILSWAELYQCPAYSISEPDKGYAFKVVLPLSGRRKSFTLLSESDNN